MIPQSVSVDLDNTILPQATFADGYQIEVSGENLDAVAATKRVMGHNPRWIVRLMRLRNMLVAPLGLKPAPNETLRPETSIGAFPMIFQSPERVVLGFDDKHLDFRIVVDVMSLGGARQSVRATTYVKTHNRLGRSYLALVTPFHRVIVPTMLAYAGKR